MLDNAVVLFGAASSSNVAHYLSGNLAKVPILARERIQGAGDLHCQLSEKRNHVDAKHCPSIVNGATAIRTSFC